MTPDGDTCSVSIGQRINCDGHFATVQYVGEVPPSKGLWLGVEWDDPSRGRHDGLHSGVQYFKTSHPTAGSFVRPSKVTFGQSLPSELKARYGIVDGKSAGVDMNVVKEVQKHINAPFVELVGFTKINEKQSCFQNLRVVDLEGKNVSSAGEEGEILELCPSVEHLNLARTLINSWSVIAQIAQQLRNLNLLNISHNRIEIPDPHQSCQMSDAFLHLEELIMKHLGYTWSDVLKCAQMWPHIISLNVSNNNIERFEIPPSGVLDRLSKLNLDETQLSNWDEVNKLGKIQSLQILSLIGTPIQRIHFPGDDTTELFPALTALWISNTLIDNWESIDELDKLPALKELSFHDTPLLTRSEELKGTGTQMVIARIGHLQMLNRFVITALDRNGAEYDYLKRYGRTWLEVKDTDLEAAFHKTHPRYRRLVERHGEIEKSEVEEKQWTLKSRSIKVKIESPNFPDRPPFCKTLPSEMAVQKLIGLAQKLFHTEGIPRLYAISEKSPDVEIELDKELQGLSYFSVESGDVISVRW